MTNDTPNRFSALYSPLGLILFLLTAGTGVAFDQWTKITAFDKLTKGIRWNEDKTQVWPVDPETYHFIPGYVDFEFIPNRGAVFGIGQGQRRLFIAVSIAAIFFIFYLFAVSGRQRVYQLILGMLLAGVLGNLYDRVEFGYVRDMIHALPRWGIFPYIFNVADSLLCVGVFFMIVYSFFHPETKQAEGRRDKGTEA
jgi:signal peptidase II